MLFVQPESFVRMDQNTTITLNLTTDEIEVQFFAAELAVELRNTQSSGAGYFITRFPKKFKVTTPHMNAAVEGTEFMVETSRDATKLTVLEGKVSSESVATRDAQLVTAGQSLAERRGGSRGHHGRRQAAGRGAMGAQVSADQRRFECIAGGRIVARG